MKLSKRLKKIEKRLLALEVQRVLEFKETVYDIDLDPSGPLDPGVQHEPLTEGLYDDDSVSVWSPRGYL